LPIKKYYKERPKVGSRVKVSSEFPFIGRVVSIFYDLEYNRLAVIQMERFNLLHIVRFDRLQLIKERTIQYKNIFASK